MSTLVTVVGIPLYRLVIVKLVPRVKHILMLTKIVGGSLPVATANSLEHSIGNEPQHKHPAWYQLSEMLLGYSPIRTCLIIRSGYYSYHTLSLVHSNDHNMIHHSSALQWSLLPACLHDSI